MVGFYGLGKGRVPIFFEFSKIILDFKLLLKVYQNEVEELETGESFKNDLYFTQDFDSILERVKRALEKKINKYFTY